MIMKENKYLDRIYQSPPPEENENKIDTSLIEEYDSWKVNPLSSYFTSKDIESIKDIARSPRLLGKPAEKYKLFGEIMRARGFIFVGGGTNRRTYVCTYDSRVVAKIATDPEGAKPNLKEFYNQNILKPFCSKIYEVEPEGYLAICENVFPIKDIETFNLFQDFIYDIFVYKIMLRGIAISDAGKRSFKNWGIRQGNFPVLLDYPDMYATDPKKHYCTRKIDEFGHTCNHPIVYSDDLDTLECCVCHQSYLPKQLAAKDGDSYISLLKTANMYKDITEDTKMIVKITTNDKEITKDLSKNTTTCVRFDRAPRRPRRERPSNLQFSVAEVYSDGTVVRPDTIILSKVVKANEQQPSRQNDINSETYLKKKVDLRKRFVDLNNLLNIDNFKNKSYSGLSTIFKDHLEEASEQFNIEYDRNSFNKNFEVFETICRNVKGSITAYKNVCDAAIKYLKMACVWDAEFAYEYDYRWDEDTCSLDSIEKIYNAAMVNTLFNKIKEFLHLIVVIGISKGTVEGIDASLLFSVHEEDFKQFDPVNGIEFVASAIIDNRRFYSPIKEEIRYSNSDSEEENETTEEDADEDAVDSCETEKEETEDNDNSDNEFSQEATDKMIQLESEMAVAMKNKNKNNRRHKRIR